MIGNGQVFTLFFVTLGPFKLLGPFAQRTHGIDEARSRQIAWWAFLVASISAIVGGLVGRSLLTNWQISLPALTMTAGIIFFLVALRQLMQQYEPPHAALPDPLPPSPVAAALRLVFPIVLTPYGIAAVIALLAASPDANRTLAIFGLLMLVMVLNLIAMIYARRILVGPVVIVLQVFGAVLAVLQVALSVEFILVGWRGLGVLPNVT